MNESLLQYGGLGLAALTIIAWAKYVFNHQKHMQESNEKTMETVLDVVERNTEAMTTLNGLVQQDIHTTKELKDIIQRNN